MNDTLIRTAAFVAIALGIWFIALWGTGTVG